MRASSLDEIRGIGKSRRLALLKHFKTIAAIAAAEITELKQVVPEPAARAVYEHFHGQE